MIIVRDQPNPAKYTLGQRVRFDIFLCEVQSKSFDWEFGEWHYTLTKFELDPNAPPQPPEDVGYMSSHEERLQHIISSRGDSDYAYEEELEAI